MYGEIGRDRAGLQFGHVQQIGDEAIEPFGFVDNRTEQIGFFAIIQLAADVA